MKQLKFKFNRQQAFKSRCGMPVRLKRILIRQEGKKCLRCMSRPILKWKRCSECIQQHSLRPNRKKVLDKRTIKNHNKRTVKGDGQQ